jgi:hypothetical protein
MTMDTCPNCGIQTSGAKSKEYWELIRSYERLAKRVGSEKDLVILAQNRLNKVCTTITKGGLDNQLPYEEHVDHVFSAFHILDSFKEAIRKRQQEEAEASGA